MTKRLPPRREIKFLAKRMMGHPLCLRVTIVLVCVQLAFYGVRLLTGGTLTYMVADLAQYADTANGIFFNDQGFSILFRMDLTQTVLAIPLTYTQIALFLLISVILFLVTAPLRLGVMEQYWNVLRGTPGAPLDLLQWFKKAGKLGKALAVEFVMGPLVRVLGILATLPSLYLYYRFYTSTPTLEAVTTASALMQSAATFLAIAAGLFTFWLHCFFLPVRYCLCAHPEYTLGQAFRRGLASAKGFRGQFFNFRLSYILWFVISQMTYGAMDFFVLPYTSLGSMIYLQEIAKVRQGEQPPAVPPEGER